MQCTYKKGGIIESKNINPSSLTIEEFDAKIIENNNKAKVEVLVKESIKVLQSEFRPLYQQEKQSLSKLKNESKQNNKNQLKNIENNYNESLKTLLKTSVDKEKLNSEIRILKEEKN